ncbi:MULTISPECIES: protein kinase [Streptomyces]|uniref:Serine/threonine protein kinase n=1 Tax=Streptomyces dengpaensis TaxID=2049881 RepID=A0ABM6SQP6_9ACTN|nr:MULTISPECIES: protein kinase [Streptomyces]AVH57007.1 serine/threonine protein kinase [Streptomyces dengpaensis]PIB09090.1 serine/threonine protein kinase [Streptomyces sp. HG99]
MDDYAGRVLADRYRLPLPPADEYELAETRAFDTYSGQEVLVRQVPLPEVVEAEVLDADGLPEGFVARDGGVRRASARTTRRPTEPAVRRAIEAAQAAAQIPDHPRLDQVFDVFAEGGSLWIVSELVPARPLAALLAEKPLSPYRAAEVASDVLTALRVLHAHGWVHRNITVRTVLVCDDGRVMLTGLAAGAAEEALCGYDPIPDRDDSGTRAAESGVAGGAGSGGRAGQAGGGGSPGAGGGVPRGAGTGAPGAPRGSGFGGGRTPGVAVAASAAGSDPEAARRAAIEARAERGAPVPGTPTGSAAGGAGPRALEAGGAEGAAQAGGAGGDIRAARAGAIAAYRAGARAAARVQEEQRGSQVALPAARPSAQADQAELAERAGQADASSPQPQPQPQPRSHAHAPGHSTSQPLGQGGGAPLLPGQATPPGQIADPYGVRAGNGSTWHGAQPRTGTGPGTGTHPGIDSGAIDGGTAQGRAALPAAGPNSAARTGTGTPALAPGQWSAAEHGGPGPSTAVGAQDHTRTPDGTQGRTGHWNELVAGASSPRRGPATALAAERARQARMAVVGPVTERWAPEQAGPVHENWQLAAPIGPATDLWALGALLFRAVQGHAPYPEENTAELVQLVCAEPPAFAEECGPLRPVVESLLRQDPTERLDFEELRGWLRSLVRSAPEPEAGTHVVATPPVDPRRLPIVRRRGELVRRRRAGLPATSPHARHKRSRKDRPAKPRRLGRNLLLLVLLLLAAGIAYAMVFMPKAEPTSSGGSGSTSGTDGDRTGAAGDVSPAPDTGGDGKASSEPRPDQTSPGADKSPSDAASSTESQSSGNADVAQGFKLRKDPEGFSVAVADGWDRTPKNGSGQVVYSQGDFELIVVPGRDSTSTYGGDPMTYQRESERELQPFRDSTWATSSGMRRIDVGGRTMAEGQFTWQDSAGRSLYVRNLAILIGGRYHVVQLRGPEAERDEVTRLYEQASATYQVAG